MPTVRRIGFKRSQGCAKRRLRRLGAAFAVCHPRQPPANGKKTGVSTSIHYETRGVFMSVSLVSIPAGTSRQVSA